MGTRYHRTFPQNYLQFISKFQNAPNLGLRKDHCSSLRKLIPIQALVSSGCKLDKKNKTEPNLHHIDHFANPKDQSSTIGLKFLIYGSS